MKGTVGEEESDVVAIVVDFVWRLLETQAGVEHGEFYFLLFVLFSFSLPLIECRNAYPMMPEPQQKSMTRFGGFLVSPTRPP